MAEEEAGTERAAKRARPEEEATPAAVTLYSYWRSSCSWRVRIALNLKQVPFQYKAIHLVKDEQTNAEFKKLNPLGQVPCLIMDGFVLTQSVAIIEFLDETVQTGAPLFPKDPKQRAVVRKLVEIINSGTQPLQNMAVLKIVEDLGGSKLSHAKTVISSGLRAFEAELATQTRDESDFCVGPNVTAADLFLLPQVYNANRFHVDMSQFPLISAILPRLEALEAFDKAKPDLQPDSAGI
ncbi:Maleylacetoacetate isomerase (MAAI) [Durusdinium trenchii]|uniref:Maleylacetoacetate isomerase (MAAI) n=1 Tax=Durusdinium trenchii TaxID=1381693 RepID=A0ABP0SG97_9DINO